MLGRYAIERFLYRLGRSPYRDKFAVKGATLFTLWTGQTHRPTKDLDLLGQGSSAIGDVEQTIRGICEIQEEDGLVFDRASVEGYRELKVLEKQNASAPLVGDEKLRLDLLHERNARGELHSYITVLNDVVFYAVFALALGVIANCPGGTAANVTEIEWFAVTMLKV